MAISSLIYDSWMKERQFGKYEGMLRMLETHLPGFPNFQGSVLDIGMGTGLFEDFLGSHGIHFDVQGVDVDADMMEQAKKKGHEIQYGDMESLHFKDNAFDFVVCIDTLHKARNLGRALSEIHKVLKPGGRALVSMFCNTFTKNSVLKMLDSLVSDAKQWAVLERRIVGMKDGELSVAFMLMKVSRAR